MQCSGNLKIRWFSRFSHFVNITLLFFSSQISSVNFKSYHTATLLGLLPAQTINVYLGSKLRTIQEVFNDHSTALAGYGVFVVEVRSKKQ
jgi:uncharacterized membrane protein YdjX (TVP38/TMEM64 family)